jgi:hypothetical protein
MFVTDEPVEGNEPCWDDYARDVPDAYPTLEEIDAMFAADEVDIPYGE